MCDADEKSRSIHAANSIDHHHESSPQVEKDAADPYRCSSTNVMRYHTRECTGDNVPQHKQRTKELLSERRNVVSYRGCRVTISKDLCQTVHIIIIHNEMRALDIRTYL